MNTFVSPYLQCPNCKRIIHDPTLRLVKTEEPCPDCGAIREFRRIWPSMIAHHWIEVVYSHPIDRPEDHNLLAVMSCAMAEVMMEGLLKNILFHQGARYEHIEILLDSHEGRNRQLQLFKKLCGSSLKEALDSMNMLDFHDAWERITRSRNKFVHGTPPGDLFKDFPSAGDLETVRTKMLGAFCELHNGFAV